MYTHIYVDAAMDPPTATGDHLLLEGLGVRLGMRERASEREREREKANPKPQPYPGKHIFLSSDGNQNYYTNSLILLIRTNCVVIFVAIK